MTKFISVEYDAQTREAYWQHVQSFFADRTISEKQKTVTVHFPKQNVLGVGTIQMLRNRKNELLKGYRKES